MNGRGRSVQGGLIPHIKPALVVLSISFAFFLGGGCSNEEEPREAESARRVVRIKAPPPKRDLAVEEKATSESEKEASLKIAEAPTAAERGANLPQDKRPEPGKANERVAAPKREKPPSPEKATKPVTGLYQVQKGDSLSTIAGRKEVYDDPMKWPDLFRLNMDKLGQINVEEGFERKDLPEGLELRFVTPFEVNKNLEKLGRKPWVVNVMSVQRPKRIVPAAIALMKKGYRVYLTKARVKGKDWVRLRIGFFKDSSEADAVRKEIMPMVNDAWLAKIGNSELKKFGGY